MTNLPPLFRSIPAPMWLPLFILATLSFNACSRQEREPVATVAKAAPPIPASAGVNLITAIEEVAEQTIPAVVHIEVTERQEVPNPLFGFEQDPFFRQFFGGPPPSRQLKREIRGLGSGMLMDAQGYILTNNHVAGGATRIEVQLANGERYPAKLVGADPQTDLAVIRIEAKETLPSVTFGDSDKVKVGQWVVAIGHPRGLDQTVTQGIISAKHRTGITSPTGYEDFLQTDAAINPGNSGGPLLTIDGKVIGVNAAIATTSGGFQGIGFAIPSNMALHVAKQLIATGKVERGWLGVSAQDLTPDLAQKFAVPDRKGALVAAVTAGGPAEKAGLKRGDVIVAFAGQAVTDSAELRNATADAAIGGSVPLTLVRDGSRLTVQVTIGNLEQQTELLLASVPRRLGVTVKAVPQKTTVEYGLDPNLGVVITRVEQDGPLAAAGFEAGDLILELNGTPVEGLASFGQMVARLHTGERIELLGLDHRTGQEGKIRVTTR
jgi:Do/DeqQ family serine protease